MNSAEHKTAWHDEDEASTAGLAQSLSAVMDGEAAVRHADRLFAADG